MSDKFEINEDLWKASVQQPVTAGARASGDCDVQSQGSGICFRSDKGNWKFLRMDYPELPTQDELDELPRNELLQLLQEAEPR